ncbi:hypothetical protein PTE30175_05416 [Pandoraea terrae]|uniref:Uncharacterized protein n=1 Tax=Pandoraea terrae TaxID=1537710 RepID=A0A5E4ZD57_9BURK|nr:hypothetical protein [Pandoraea terrae]VVE59321.1 hypothetical protein PTE30175_05416 [Pandoraea terrae]
MRKEVKVNVCGRPYLIHQMAAREGFEYLAIDSADYTVEELVKGVKVKVAGQWVAAEDEEVINVAISDAAGILPPYKVLWALNAEVRQVNFGFLAGRKKPEVPGRFRSNVDTQEADGMDPLIANLFASGKASMIELETVYSVEDAVRMMDSIVVANVNQALIDEAAMAEAKSKSKR